MEYTRRYCVYVALLAALTLPVAAGCGSGNPSTVPVKGTVTLNGNPVDGASVTFVPEAGGRPATGTTDASGQFTLTTFETGDGAPEGKYKVGVNKTSAAVNVEAGAGGAAPPGVQLSGPPGSGGPPPRPKSELPEKYGNAEKSGLTVEVKSGMEPVKLDLQP